jgi:isopropylmalate/homocitrate/citramalate synthase
VLKDSTLREGLDVPGVRFSATQKLQIVAALASAGVPEAEVVAPSRVERDLKFARKLRECASTIRVSGLLYANWTRCEAELERASTVLDRVDLLMPLSEQREPRERPAKLARLLEVLAHSRCYALEVGAGFPHATQADSDFVLEIARRAVAAGARRVTVYDTNGGAGLLPRAQRSGSRHRQCLGGGGGRGRRLGCHHQRSRRPRRQRQPRAGGDALAPQGDRDRRAAVRVAEGVATGGAA